MILIIVDKFQREIIDLNNYGTLYK